MLDHESLHRFAAIGRAMQKPQANRTFDSWALVAAVLSPADSHVRHRPLFYKVVPAVLGDDDVSSLYSEFCFLCLTNPGKVWSAAETHEAGVHQVVVLRTLTGEATGVRLGILIAPLMRQGRRSLLSYLRNSLEVCPQWRQPQLTRLEPWHLCYSVHRSA